MSAPEPVYLVGPVALIGAYRGRAFRRSALHGATTIGEPLLEAAGVPNRRAAVAHHFDGPSVALAKRVIDAAGHGSLVQFLEALPDDWRPSAPGLP